MTPLARALVVGGVACGAGSAMLAINYPTHFGPAVAAGALGVSAGLCALAAAWAQRVPDRRPYCGVAA
jgi:hypothetical protein